MKNQYWTLCDKSEDCISKCPYAEHHWYQQQGHIVNDKYICFLPDMEDCPHYQKKKYEKTPAPARLKSDLKYELDDVVSIEMKVASEGENKNKTIISFKNGSTLECLKSDQKVVRGHRANFPMFEDGVPQDIVDALVEVALIESNVAKEITNGEESQTCVDCGHFDDTGLLQCWCKEIQHYAHRKTNPCEAFVERKKYNADIKPHKGKLNECWWCDYHIGSLGGKKKCQLLHPDIRDGKCHSIKSTGANQ